MEPVPILIVGVDIGVSTSGISCCLLDPGATTPQEPKSIRLSGGVGELRLVDIQPTELGIGEGSKTYGNGIANDEEKLTLPKLSMLGPTELYGHDDPRNHEIIRLALDKIENHYPGTGAVAEYIKRLWAEGSRHVEAYLKANGLQPNEVEVRFVFGVPAVWKQEATNKMREAIEESGILASGRLPAALGFVQEPVAAALAVVPDVARDHGLNVDEKVLILDCGGGTVDTVVYKLKSLSPNRVETEECLAPEGTFLGAIFMKSAFASLVKQKVEEKMGDGYEHVNQAALNSKIDKEWKYIETETSRYWAAEDDELWLGIQRIDQHASLSVNLVKSHIHAALLPTAKNIGSFVEKRMRTAGEVARIVVVGGFGRNALVQAELKHRFQEKVVFTDDAGELAVKKGACLRGIQLAQDEKKRLEEIQLAQDEDKREATSSFGYRLGEESTKIKWFIIKPTYSPFPPEEAFTRGAAPSLVIYKTLFKMGGLADYPVGDTKVKKQCVIKCNTRELLSDGSPRKLAVYMRGTVTEFGAHVGGQPCPDDHFTVSGAK